MHLSFNFKSVYNKEGKGVICNMTSLSNSSQSTCQIVFEWSLFSYRKSCVVFVYSHCLVGKNHVLSLYGHCLVGKKSCIVVVCNKEGKGVICNMTSSSNSSQSTRPVGRVLLEELLVLSRFRSQLREDEWNFCPMSFLFVCFDSLRPINNLSVI